MASLTVNTKTQATAHDDRMTHAINNKRQWKKKQTHQFNQSFNFINEGCLSSLEA